MALKWLKIQYNCPQHSENYIFLLKFAQNLRTKIYPKSFRAETELCEIDPWNVCVTLGPMSPRALMALSPRTGPPCQTRSGCTDERIETSALLTK
jgi:hypothetical protein